MNDAGRVHELQGTKEVVHKGKDLFLIEVDRFGIGEDVVEAHGEVLHDQVDLIKVFSTLILVDVGIQKGDSVSVLLKAGELEHYPYFSKEIAHEYFSLGLDFDAFDGHVGVRLYMLTLKH